MIVAIPEVLREKLGPEGARALAELLNEASVQTRGDVIEIAASRFERRLAEEVGGLRAEIGALRGDLEARFAELRGDLDARFAELRGDLDARFGAQRGGFDSKIGGLRGEFDSKIGDLHGEMGKFEGRITRWMFVFWIGQIGVLLAMFFAFFRS